VNNIAHQGFVAGDRFNVYELTSKRDNIHAKENNASARPSKLRLYGCAVETLLGSV
jgi:hypothetical protein